MHSWKNANPIFARFGATFDTLGSLSMATAQKIGYWIAAARPKTLLLAITPVFAGVSLAAAQTGEIAWLTALMTLLVAISIQIGTNLHNDAGDYERGTDTAERVGPPRATAQGWLSAKAVKRAGSAIFLFGFIIGVLLAFRGGWPSHPDCDERIPAL